MFKNKNILPNFTHRRKRNESRRNYSCPSGTTKLLPQRVNDRQNKLNRSEYTGQTSAAIIIAVGITVSVLRSADATHACWRSTRPFHRLPRERKTSNYPPTRRRFHPFAHTACARNKQAPRSGMDAILYPTTLLVYQGKANDNEHHTKLLHLSSLQPTLRSTADGPSSTNTLFPIASLHAYRLRHYWTVIPQNDR